jgi:Uma2 family endonuclease
MNVPVRPPTKAPVRHLFTGDDVLRMQDAGVLLEGGPFELIDGEIIDMPSEGDAHMLLRIALTKYLVRALPDEIAIASDGTLRLGEFDWPEPDFHLFPDGMPPSAVRGPDVLLVIELSDSSLGYDMTRKADLYRRAGVREYWVIDLKTRRLHVHRADGPWPAAPIPITDTVEPNLRPGVKLRIADVLRE